MENNGFRHVWKIYDEKDILYQTSKNWILAETANKKDCHG